MGNVDCRRPMRLKQNEKPTAAGSGISVCARHIPAQSGSMRIPLRSLCVALSLLISPFARAAASAGDAAFETAAKAFIEDYLRLNPEAATDLGDHRYDGRLTDYSAAALATRIETWRKHLGALEKIDAAQ